MTTVARVEGSTLRIGSISVRRARAAEILRTWRQADRRLRAIEPGPEADDLLADLLRLRAEYLSVVDGDGQAFRSFPVSDRYLLSS